MTLESYVYSQKLKADFSRVTDKEGNIVCEVEQGLYLLLGEGKRCGNDYYTPPANLVAVPNRDVNGKWQNQIILDYSKKVDVRSVVEKYTVQKYGQRMRRLKKTVRKKSW